MSRQEVIRAWKDEEYRESLSFAQRAQLPEHPAGLIELSDDDLDLAAGGSYTIRPTQPLFTFLCCYVPR